MLTVHRRVSGVEDSDTLRAMEDLAELLSAQGDAARSRALREQVLAVRRRVLGEEHPDTLLAIDNVAKCIPRSAT